MTMTDSERLSAAMRLIRVVTGEEYGDGEVVTNIGIGYAGGNGMSGMSDVWVTGDWNDRTHYESGTRVIDSTVPSRLFDALERLKVNGEWSDEWDTCAECYKLIRTEPDSYCWTPQFILTDDGELVCRDCMLESPAEFVDGEFANHPDRAITWLSERELAELGWHDAFPDEHSAQHGWHPGQNDTPASVLKAWRATLDDTESDFVFIIVDKGQFDVSFRLYVRDEEE